MLSRLHTGEARRAARPQALQALGTDYFVDVSLLRAGDLIRVHAKLAHQSGWTSPARSVCR